MSVTVDSTGITTQTFEEILEEIVAALQVNLSLTDAQANRIQTSLQSGLGQWSRIQAEREVLEQEALSAVYDTLSLTTDGANLDRVVRLLGLTRRAAVVSEVTGTITGTAAVVVPAGFRIQYNPDGTVWVTDAEYTIGGGGTVTVTLEREEADSAAPGASTDWTNLDTLVGFTSFESTAQPVVGNDVETDGELRVRATTEAYRRSQGPLAAIEAAVSEVEGVTYVAAWDNPSPSTDSDGIVAYATNVVVQGGADTEIITAILNARAAGSQMQGAVTETRNLGGSKNVTIGFDRVTNVDLHIRCTLTTSTSEDETPAGIDATVAALLLEQAAVLFGIGDDVLPWRLEAVIHVAAYPGIDNVVVEVSDDGSSWSTNKYEISIRELAAFDAARITVTTS